MSDQPLVSFIVLSYNYEDHILKTLQSILDQTFSNFEVVVVDDASSDRSCEAIRSFGDPRIRLYINQQNLGGAASYNRAVSLCRGEYLANLDADDWIDSRKTEIQLQAFAQDPSLDILGTYVSYVDDTGRSHSQSVALESWTNRPDDLNLASSWIARNSLCRSSTMLRRSVHERIGLDDPTMVRAPDYELWTRALYKGCKFGVLQEPLTFYRQHSNAVTHGDARGTFLEVCYLMHKNMVPVIETRATYDCFYKMVDWVVSHSQFAACQPVERYRLLGTMFTCLASNDFATFREAILSQEGDPNLASTGRKCLAAFTLHPARQYAERLLRDIDKFIEARDFWHAQSDRWEREYAKLKEKESECRDQPAAQSLGAGDLTRRLLRWSHKRRP